MSIRLTQYSHGAGCGCKISPSVLGVILKNNMAEPSANLIVGNSDRDDAAAYLLGEGQVLLSTTDFFMPIVDDAKDFGRIAAANAISDIYAMGGRPIMALAILGWPIDKLSAEVANQVIVGAREVASQCGMTIAGGHSIDAPEPIFGLSVNGLVAAKNLKRNSTVEQGDLLVLTKPLGIGMHTTAMKRGVLNAEHQGLAIKEMLTLNSIGRQLAELPAVHALTDVTGFGLAGHLLEMVAPRNLAAEIEFAALPQLPGLEGYFSAGVIPGGTTRNFNSFGDRLAGVDDAFRRALVCDPQTSGGLLIALAPEALGAVRALFQEAGIAGRCHVIGKITASGVNVRVL
ncbi:selenide, water dikinase SelD [Turneriella parva]|uniref:Selenide, water dikinase n=1 Tax=Turneriella parva (strain ATCC BAA-1111 / DSM 21527 / NCTC 11395 / H) TaxID=869212 RepID=I4B4M6_TURPD|nr:selenide, water dikinase SelD [Turneriella parva]AFM12233.1 selenophosphate synthase [Turneriella parva DSM 21527]